MEAEFIKLAQAGVTALQAGPPPNWAEIVAAVGGGVVGLVQCGLIAWGLRQMGKVSEDRNRQMSKSSEERTAQLDIMREESRGQLDIMREESRAQLDIMREESRAQTKVLADIGQGIRDQGMVLAKLLQPTP